MPGTKSDVRIDWNRARRRPGWSERDRVGRRHVGTAGEVDGEVSPCRSLNAAALLVPYHDPLAELTRTGLVSSIDRSSSEQLSPASRAEKEAAARSNSLRGVCHNADISDPARAARLGILVSLSSTTRRPRALRRWTYLNPMPMSASACVSATHPLMHRRVTWFSDGRGRKENILSWRGAEICCRKRPGRHGMLGARRSRGLARRGEK
jgi:hypothetical protein